MWRIKDDERIFYIDMELELEVRPTIFCDNTRTPFKDKQFDTIFYDPPHSWKQGEHWYTHPRRSKEYFERYGDRSIPRYYGWDKYKNKSQLCAHIYKAQTEFIRILKDDGLLWLKWNEVAIELNKVLAYFIDWVELMRLDISARVHPSGEQSTYWVVMAKKQREDVQVDMTQFPTGRQEEWKKTGMEKWMQ